MKDRAKHLRRLWKPLAALLSTSCASAGPHQSRGPSAVPPDTVAVALSSAKDSSADSATRAALNRAFHQADLAAHRVDTILVSPDSLTLRVGEEVAVFAIVRIEGRTMAGDRVDGFAPMLRSEDWNVAALTGKGLVGRRPGRTRLLVEARTNDPSAAIRARPAVVVVHVSP